MVIIKDIESWVATKALGDNATDLDYLNLRTRVIIMLKNLNCKFEIVVPVPTPVKPMNVFHTGTDSEKRTFDYVFQFSVQMIKLKHW